MSGWYWYLLGAASFVAYTLSDSPDRTLYPFLAVVCVIHGATAKIIAEMKKSRGKS